MPSGFQAWTDTGFYQIDGDSLNLGFRQKATLTTSQGGAGNDLIFTVTCQFQFTAVNPVLAVYAPGTPVANVSTQALGNNTWLTTFTSYQATTFDVYVFDRMSQCPLSGENVGLQCFSSTGELLADTRIPFLNVLANPSGTVNTAGAAIGVTNNGVLSQQQYTFGVSKVATVIGITGVTYAGSGVTQPSQNLGLSTWVVSSWMHSGGTAFMCNTEITSALASMGVWQAMTSIVEPWSGLIIDVSNLP